MSINAIIRLGRTLATGVLMLPGLVWGQVVQLQDIQFAAQPGNRFEVQLDFSETPPEPSGFTIDTPARVVLDFPGVTSTLIERNHALSFENAESAVVLGTEERTRLVVNLRDLAPYSYRIEGTRLYLNIGSDVGAESLATRASDQQLARAAESSILDVDFRRGEEGEGLVSIELSHKGVNADVRRTANGVEVTFYQTRLPESLNRRLNVLDFATPVKTIDARTQGRDTSFRIDATGDYEYLVYQTDDRYVVSVKPLTPEELEGQRSRFAYVGDKLSLNFQDIEVRSVLQIIADFTGLNLVASDTVTGNITLRLENVPWDQALDIVLKSKGLDKRQDGNVLMVAPAAEIAEQERLQVEANRQLQELAPLRTEFVRIRYADARQVYQLFSEQNTGGGRDSGPSTRSILSERGSAIVDERTNTIILTDTEDKIGEFRRLIRELDVPIRQVMIEARIVIANTNFRRELGVRWGVQAARRTGNTQIGTSGSLEAFESPYNPLEVFSDAGGTILVNEDALNVDLGVANPAGRVAFELLRDNTFLDLELSALEDSGNGEVLSQPKVITGDKQLAVIESGKEIPFLEATSSGAASLQFKEAFLKLEVTPQITPDNRVVMDLEITQDSLGEEVSGLFGSMVPTIDVTRVATQTLVGNGQTMVLGGIFEMQDIRAVEKVPFLGDLPGLKHLFRKTLSNQGKREILVFITPRIVEDSLLDQAL